MAFAVPDFVLPSRRALGMYCFPGVFKGLERGIYSIGRHTAFGCLKWKTGPSAVKLYPAVVYSHGWGHVGSFLSLQLSTMTRQKWISESACRINGFLCQNESIVEHEIPCAESSCGERGGEPGFRQPKIFNILKINKKYEEAVALYGSKPFLDIVFLDLSPVGLVRAVRCLHLNFMKDKGSYPQLLREGN